MIKVRMVVNSKLNIMVIVIFLKNGFISRGVIFKIVVNVLSRIGCVWFIVVLMIVK